MFRQILGLAAWGVMAAAALGCGAGGAEDTPKVRCDQVRAADKACVDDAAYQQCLTCEQTCDEPCATLESCPVQFACQK